jgi:PAS domain S-box-containing protein
LAVNEDLARQVAERELAAAVFRNAAEAIVVTDEKGIIVQVNPAFSQITGYEADEVLGKPASLLKSGRHSQEFFAGMWQGLKREGRWQGEVWKRRGVCCLAVDYSNRRTRATDPLRGELDRHHAAQGTGGGTAPSGLS